MSEPTPEPSTAVTPESAWERVERLRHEAEVGTLGKEKADKLHAQRIKRHVDFEMKLEAHREKLARDRAVIAAEGDVIEGGEDVEDVVARGATLPAKIAPVYIPPEEAERLRDETARRGMSETECCAFLFNYATTGMFNQASYAAGRDPGTVKKFMQDNPAFEALVGQAKLDFRELMEAEVIRRGRDGIVKPVFGKEGVIGYEREYSDKLLELAIRAAWPEKYREKNGILGDLPDGAKFGVLVVPGIVATPEEWEALHGKAARGELPQPVDPPNIAERPAGDNGRRIPLPKVARPVVPSR